MLISMFMEFKPHLSSSKRYDASFLGRLRANATFQDPNAVDQLKLMLFAIDLTLLSNNTINMTDIVAVRIERFQTRRPFAH